MGVLIQHGCDHTLQACKLQTGTAAGTGRADEERKAEFGKLHQTLHTDEDRQEARGPGRKPLLVHVIEGIKVQVASIIILVQIVAVSLPKSAN